jgi:hypothetical protein
MAKTLKDILNGVKASKVVPGSTGKDPGVDYAPKAPNEQEFVKLHKTEKHSDRVGNTDELYQATNIKHSQVNDPKHGYKKPEDKSVNEAAKCNMTEEGVSCPVHEMADCSTPKKTLKEVLTKKTSAGEIIKDFRKSKDQKFAGKSGEERQRMALGAYYSMHPEKSKKTNEGFNSGALHGVGSTEIVEATDLHPDYKLVKTGKKSTTAHPDGKPTYDLHYKGEKLTSIHPYSAYKDKKTPGSRIVASRKDITKYSASLAGSKTSDLDDTTPAHVANNVIRRHQASLKEDLAVPLLGGSDDDESAEMAKTQLRALANKALHLAMKLGDEQIIEPWVQAKIAVAKDHVNAVHDYMVYGDHSKDKENEQTAPYVGGVDMTGSPRNTFPSYSVDVNTGRNV